ncbi:MAG TPA: DUF3786 domain-containing protein [Syntrophorhabdaceae bacterium]|nr:DUF3786 domain-containing protein [Syntrophorhabdaceae bacterium]
MIEVLKKQKVYKRVFEDACNQLRKSNVKERFQKSGITYRESEKGYRAEIPFFNEIITMLYPEFKFISSKSPVVNLVTKVIILHYINFASGDALNMNLLSYEDIPGCKHYMPIFEKRVTKPLEKAFALNRDAFLEAGRSLNGFEETYGDASFTLYPLPRVPITFILWEADEEFPPSVRVLFDETINSYLPLEDITVIARLAAMRIIKAARIHYGQDDI